MTASLLIHDEPPAAERIAAATGWRYEVTREIGRGGMSRVYLAWDRQASRRIAIKVLVQGRGTSLADALTQGRCFEPADVVRLLAPIVDALAHAHRGGVIHRDVKPANILLHADDGWPFLTDFGIATLRTSEQSRAETGKGFGTPDFMSPEQAAGTWDADHRSDVYSLGDPKRRWRDAGALRSALECALTVPSWRRWWP